MDQTDKVNESVSLPVINTGASEGNVSVDLIPPVSQLLVPTISTGKKLADASNGGIKLGETSTGGMSGL